MKLVVVFVTLALPAFAQYAAPAILSRGEAPPGMSEQTESGFHFSLALTSDYTNGLIGITPQSADVPLTGQGAFGGGATLGATLGHTWGRTQIDLRYTGNFKEFSQTTNYSGINQSLSVDLVQAISPRVSLFVKESAGMFLRSLPTTVSSDSSNASDSLQAPLPTTDFSNNLTTYSRAQADVVFQETARLSFDLGGSYFRYEEQEAGLYGTQGAMAMADAQYRLSAQATIGVLYTFADYSYTQGIGSAAIHAAGATGAWRLSEHTEFSFFAGPARMHTSFREAVPIDPTVLAILCPSDYGIPCPVKDGSFISKSTSWEPNFSARFAKSFSRGTAFIHAGESLTPGNGLFLTSRSIMGSAGYNYSGLRDWNCGVSATYMSALATGGEVGHYQDLVGSYRMSRHIVGPLSFVSSFSAARYQSAAISAYNRLIYMASVGLRFSNSERPIGSF